jgi:hypothetical protein
MQLEIIKPGIWPGRCTRAAIYGCSVAVCSLAQNFAKCMTLPIMVFAKVLPYQKVCEMDRCRDVLLLSCRLRNHPKKACVDASSDSVMDDGTAPRLRCHRRALVKVPTAVVQLAQKAPMEKGMRGYA